MDALVRSSVVRIPKALISAERPGMKPVADEEKRGPRPVPASAPRGALYSWQDPSGNCPLAVSCPSSQPPVCMAAADISLSCQRVTRVTHSLPHGRLGELLWCNLRGSEDTSQRIFILKPRIQYNILLFNMDSEQVSWQTTGWRLKKCCILIQGHRGI